MTPSAIVHTFFCLVLLNAALAQPSSSWSPLQTLSETLEYETQPHRHHVSVRDVLLRASLGNKHAGADAFDDATQSFARLRRCTAIAPLFPHIIFVTLEQLERR